MAILTMWEAYQRGMLKKGTQILMPVDSTRETEVPEFLSGIEGGYTVKYNSEMFREGILFDRCLCTVIGKSKHRYIKAVGEIMPNYVKLRGRIGLTRVGSCLNYVVDSQFGYPELGIAVEHITGKETKKYRKRDLIPCPESEWDNCHWLPSREVDRSYNGDYNFALLCAGSDGLYYYRYLYECNNDSMYSNGDSSAVRPVYDLPIYNSDITILVDENHDGKSEETAFIVQGPGMPEIA